MAKRSQRGSGSFAICVSFTTKDTEDTKVRLSFVSGLGADVRAGDQVADLQRFDHVFPARHLAEHGVLPVEIGTSVQCQIELAVRLRWIAHMCHADSTLDVETAAGNLGGADRLAARGGGAAAPKRAGGQIACLRIAELDDETRNRPMDPLAVVETALHQRDDVSDGLWRIARKRFERERPAARFDHD